MIKLRLDLLDAFLRPGSTELKSYFGAGQMVLVDLTDPFLDGKLYLLQTMEEGLLTPYRRYCSYLVRHCSGLIHAVGDGNGQTLRCVSCPL